MASTSGPGLAANSFGVPWPRRPYGPATTTDGSASASMRGDTASPVRSTPESKRITTSPAAASMPALTDAPNPRGGSSLLERKRPAARLSSQAAIRVSPELSTINASKSALQYVKTDRSQRSASGFQPYTTVSSVTARADGASAVLGGAFSALS